MNPFEIDGVYTFNTLAPAILGASFKNVTVLAILNYNVASSYINIESNHVNIYPYLPVGTVNDPKTYQYLLIKTQTGENTVLALPWINLATVNKVVSQTIAVTVNNVTVSDTTKIRDSLILLGYTDFAITIK
jgi:hypothetical protein